MNGPLSGNLLRPKCLESRLPLPSLPLHPIQSISIPVGSTFNRTQNQLPPAPAPSGQLSSPPSCIFVTTLFATIMKECILPVHGWLRGVPRGPDIISALHEGKLSHGKARDFLSQLDDLSLGYPGGNFPGQEPSTPAILWGLRGVVSGCMIHSDSRRPSSAPCLPAEGPTAEGLAGSRGCLAPTVCRLHNADIHPRQALALLASEGGVG